MRENRVGAPISLGAGFPWGYRCSYHANRSAAVCDNNRLVRQDVIEDELLRDEPLTVDVIRGVLEEA